MAEKAGGTLIHADAFDKFQPIFEAAMAKRPTGAPRIEVKVPGDPIGGFVWTQQDGDHDLRHRRDKTRIPEDTTAVFYLLRRRSARTAAPSRSRTTPTRPSMRPTRP